MCDVINMLSTGMRLALQIKDSILRVAIMRGQSNQSDGCMRPISGSWDMHGALFSAIKFRNNCAWCMLNISIKLMLAITG